LFKAAIGNMLRSRRPPDFFKTKQKTIRQGGN